MSMSKKRFNTGDAYLDAVMNNLVDSIGEEEFDRLLEQVENTPPGELCPVFDEELFGDPSPDAVISDQPTVDLQQETEVLRRYPFSAGPTRHANVISVSVPVLQEADVFQDTIMAESKVRTTEGGETRRTRRIKGDIKRDGAGERGAKRKLPSAA
jgi:hypothetical protein